MSTRNLCFGSKISKIGIPLYERVYISRTCFRDGYDDDDKNQGSLYGVLRI